VTSAWNYSIDELIMSKYYGTIVGGSFYNGPMSFGDIVASHKDGLGSLTFDLSIGQKLDRLDTYNHDGGNEYDFTVDHNFKIGKGQFPVLVDAGVCFLAVHDLSHLKGYFCEQFVRFDLPIMAKREGGPLFQPYVETYHFNTLGNGFENKQWWVYAGAFRDQPLGIKLFKNDLVLNADYRIGISQGALGSRDGVEYHRIALSVPFHFGKWTIAPSVIGQTPGGSHRSFVTKTEVFGTLFIKRGF